MYGGSEGGDSHNPAPAELKRGNFSFPDLAEHEVLVEPLYGCWEGNMTHALNRNPVDICRQRNEEAVVIGNAGVVRVLKAGSAVKGICEGDIYLVFCNGDWDELGYAKKIYAYDAPRSVGLLAKRTKLHEKQLIPIPPDTRQPLEKWAAFSLRYITAWANWNIAYGCLRLHLAHEDNPSPFVWGWGGGVTLAELTLARHSGCQVAMISSNDERLKLIQEMNILPIDRRQFCGLDFDPEKYNTDQKFKRDYLAAEEAFLAVVKEYTLNHGVSIFIDYIGSPVFRATLKSLARPGVITTAGWKKGMNLSTIRAVECMTWHMHVHTHYARYADGFRAIRFAEEHDWMPPIDGKVYDWDSIPQLARNYAEGRIASYFPIYQVNPL